MKSEVKIPEGTEEERIMYLKLAKKFGLKLVKEEKVVSPIPGKVKVLKVISYCCLCETTSITFIRMLKYTDKMWRKDKYITGAEAKKVPRLCLREDRLDCCSNCEAFLMGKEKIELVRMITRASSPALVGLVSKRALEDIRMEKEEE